ncbi:MAG: thioredoxin domain-containing protein, partial [Chloroflexi bacterium]|nr:thioredoxin domain-containing protein [Chloroflexota bacterium]
LSPKLESRQYLPVVMREHAAAKTRGVGGTPSYLIGGELLGGDISLEDLAAAIKKAGQT